MSIKNFPVLVILFCIIYVQFGWARSVSRYVTLSHVKARVVAMGGAYSAVEDNLGAFFYNPATFEQYQNQKDFRLTFYLNPFASLVSLYDQQNQKPEQFQSWRQPLAFLVKGVTFTARNLEGGFVFGEESLANQPLNFRKKFFDADSHWFDYSHSFALRLRLAPQVAIGFSATAYYTEQGSEKTWGFGNSYGVLLRPDAKLNVGVFYVELPEKLTDHRKSVERLWNDSVNIGLAYHPRAATTISFDFRNINNESDENAIEPHIGFEQGFGSWCALRGGFFQRKNGTNSFSAGVGMFSSNLVSRKKNHFTNQHFILNYSFVLEQEKTQNVMWHFFAFQARI